MPALASQMTASSCCWRVIVENCNFTPWQPAIKQRPHLDVAGFVAMQGCLILHKTDLLHVQRQLTLMANCMVATANMTYIHGKHQMQSTCNLQVAWLFCLLIQPNISCWTSSSARICCWMQQHYSFTAMGHLVSSGAEGVAKWPNSLCQNFCASSFVLRLYNGCCGLASVSLTCKWPAWAGGCQLHLFMFGCLASQLTGSLYLVLCLRQS